ncbi:hypothetical protein AAX05_06165 [Moraxella bovoculi]|uniref:Uncharacterized protein n=1 Tax=Moraxella bovoculi TaxID=386891 RepID=A0AAC8PXU1_9GAMM|nr:hypothetical protein [Moraxella bovoculi]AKG07589.1 hypothetical protein AAX06_04785 [Moraxella bovoculi]AKG09809.1 hypothetical protein AAX05_06165 [Moraxella bovoculi]AKG11727.1 hypothetical protein AAX07_06720 [Moraxella bovoculi]AKG13694.1 hypothetical protein AAX11_06250 [Moraxella bovoculi]
MDFYRDKQIIPCYVFEWGWETFIDFNILEKHIEKNKIYLVIQDNHFNPLSSRNNQQVIQNSDIGNTKVFLQFNRYAEINGGEFSQEEIDFSKIIIGRVVNISTLKNESSTITKTFGNYHALTPIYSIEIIDIFHLKEYLFNTNIARLNDFKIYDENGFNFETLNRFYDDYFVDAHLLGDDCIVIRTLLSEYSFQYFIVFKKWIDDKWVFFIKFFVDFYCDTTNYQLADYPLTQEQIKLLCANNFECFRFFM